MDALPPVGSLEPWCSQYYHAPHEGLELESAPVERRLEGKRVLVTRPKERVAELCFLLDDEGAQVLSLPLLELRPPEDPRPLAAAAESIQRYRWVVFASPSAVDALMDALREAGTVERMGRVLVA